MERLRRMLTEVRRLDTRRQVLGAGRHRYRSTPVARSEIEAFEREHGVALPEEFRSFLETIGHGAGPYYGLWSLRAIAEELSEEAGGYAEEFGAPPRLDRPFPISAGEAAGLVRRLRTGGEHPEALHPYPCNGCMPIAHQGLTYWAVLVTTGELTGTVWDVDSHEGFQGEWQPARRPPGMTRRATRRDLGPLTAPPRFRTWYEGWLEHCLSDLSPDVA